jgi:hypothetical protein
LLNIYFANQFLWFPRESKKRNIKVLLHFYPISTTFKLEQEQ